MKFKDASFTAVLEGTRLVFSGKIEKSDYSSFSLFLKQVDAAVKEKELLVDIRRLDFINSGGIRSLAVFFLGSGKDFRIIIDPEKSWQKAGILSLVSLKDEGKVKVEEEEKA